MSNTGNDEFFGCIGEIWRDITAIEFFMRCAISKYDADIHKLPTPPYIKGKRFTDYPDAFKHFSFEIITEKFKKRFPEIPIPKELIRLRDAMAHGIIAEIQHSKTEQLIKFKEIDQCLEVEFSMPLGIDRLKQLRQSIHELRQYVMVKASD